MGWKFSIGLFALLLCIKCTSGDHKPTMFKGCPTFNIKTRLSIIEKSCFPCLSFSTTPSMSKLFRDTEFIFSMISPHLLDDQFCDLQSSGEFMMMFPSAVWLPEKNMFLTVVRMSIRKNGSMKSLLFTSLFDSHWNEVITEEMIGATQVPGIIPIEVYDYNIENAGPEDPRIFTFAGGIYVIFNMIDIDVRRKMFLFNFETGKSWPLRIIEHSLWSHYTEKNWTPLIVDDEHLYFVYNYKNFQILDCTDKSTYCKKVSGLFDSVPAGLRGGSPYVKFGSTQYFVSFGYSHIDYRKGNQFCAVYRPALTVVKANEESSSFELIYQSEPIDFEEKLFLEPIMPYNSTDQVKICEDGRIMMVASIARWDFDEDVVDATINLNDTIPLAIKITGLTDLVLDAIKMHEGGLVTGEENCIEKLAFKHFEIDDPSSSRLNLRKKRMMKYGNNG
ncbi:unnamed protein product [Blepharisma stoltei]|uniref:Uncharacterized protein n=1 Tax=Blepharisma stoltei TaxID=1481888 RepID=A0AAU9KA90_9CILI|nr:unnamed protein product [Blepharisma stoltei]